MNFNFYCHQVVCREWDAIHLYIANNLDWMKVWIERCEQYGHGISWEGLVSLVKAAHRNGDTNLTQREIDLAYGLKDKQASILSNHTIFFCCKHIDVHVDFFLVGNKHALNHKWIMM